MMDLERLLNDKGVKAKEKTEALSRLIVDGQVPMAAVITYGATAKDAAKGTCIEAIEFATRADPKVATLDCLQWVAASLADKAPRVKWESAKVIGNIAHLFPDQLDLAVRNLLTNAEDSGTVVRWSAAFALGQIILTQHPETRQLVPALQAICDREEKNSIKKIYLAALKKVAK